jgi:hypothetical protein
VQGFSMPSIMTVEEQGAESADRPPRAGASSGEEDDSGDRRHWWRPSS